MSECSGEGGSASVTAVALPLPFIATTFVCRSYVNRGAVNAEDDDEDDEDDNDGTDDWLA